MSIIAFEHGPARAYVDPYVRDDAADHPLPPPHPADRIGSVVGPRDRRKLDLHAALTAAGIPPRPADREAIEQLSALPGEVSDTVRRWLRHSVRQPGD
ncbi:hypothetical protein [Streptomyces fumanus]|uniref:Uncharacterized protein n=1 Tax=Streptomyces fumanus TaxID=67302 RepID=A0A919A9E5_9ACTN|nr:hypothetical protein [Streptomyces fumanus]GHE94471.1 hypothetical protein GCM10018772_18150 [Streptomyces fumanus]